MQDKALILIVDDVASNIQTLATILKNDYQIKIAKSGARAIELAGQEPCVDLILLDVKMPDMDGYEVLEQLKENIKTKDIPVIFVTGNDSLEDEEKGLIHGAVDYIAKPVRPQIVKARVQTHITLKLQRDELLYMALHDKLTGLYNRHYLSEAGNMKFSRAVRHNDNLVLIMVDIDHFKDVNDTYGHLMGDKILQQVAKILNESNRSEDFTARYGGEEFVIMLENCDINSAKNKAETLRATIESLQPESIDITSSFGIAQLSDKHTSFEELLKDADEALYSAKESGRNRVVIKS